MANTNISCTAFGNRKSTGVLTTQRAGRRTNNNPFIIRCAAERARASRKVLYLASVDISNAFPSVNHSKLWTKLHDLGMQGPLFDVYRTVYEHMAYCVRHEGDYSELFHADMGVLIGDPLSPIMWLLYFSDVRVPESLDDVNLNGQLVSHLEQADDIVLFALSPRALQEKLDAFFQWCRENFLQVNELKSWWMPLGSIPRHMPDFRLNGRLVPHEEEKAYVGVVFRSTASNYLSRHTAIKAVRAHTISCLIYGVLDRKCTEVPPFPARRLYMGLVDPHLTHGCDICPDHTLAATKRLEAVQNRYLRKALRLGPRCSLAPLYTEMGVVPVRYRRADLAVRFLGYLLQCPQGYLVRRALADSVALANAGQKSWYGDLRRALALLPVPVYLQTSPWAVDIDSVRNMIRHALHTHLERALAGNPKLELLLRRPGPLCKDGASWGVASVLQLRAYLKIPVADHRVALTRLLVSDHGLAVERLRYEGVPREHRLCRFCEEAVEDPLHALLACEGSADLTRMRSDFYAGLAEKEASRYVLVSALNMSPERCVQFLVASEVTLPTFARYVRDVLRCYDEHPIFRVTV